MSTVGLLRFVALRVLGGIILILVVAFIVFLAVSILPGDAATAVLGRNATPERVAALQEKMNLDQPLPLRFGSWLSGVLHGNLGTSLTSDRDVWSLLGPRLFNSLILACLAALVIVPVGIVLGAISGSRAGSVRDRGVSVSSLILLSIPEFVLGAALITVLAIWTGWLPPVSLFNPEDGPMSSPQVLVLPVLTLVLTNLGYVARIVRASVARSMDGEVVKMARLNGYPERQVVWGYSLRNSLAPSIQVSALVVLYLISGVVVVETVFQYPGIGQLALEATTNRDFVLLQSLVVVATAIFVLVNIVTDLLIVLVTPRLRTAL